MEKTTNFQNTSPDKIQWVTLTGVLVFHIMAVWALFTFSWQNLIAAVITWWIAGSWGIGLGYHRLLTHGGYKVPKLLEYFLTVCGMLGFQSGAISWVTTHRIHHAFTETEKDPHSPRGGVFWAHMGWIFKGTAQAHDDETMWKYAPDLMKDKVHVFLNKIYWFVPLIVGVVLYAIGGWSMVLWGIFLRQVIGWHSTWLVNSATHLWGSRRFDIRDDSRNNALIAALTFGEGWHNNHHAHPRSSRHGLAWYEFDVNWMQIKFLEKIGLAKKVYAYNLKKEGHNQPQPQPRTYEKAA